jgi:HNH endonuclease
MIGEVAPAVGFEPTTKRLTDPCSQTRLARFDRHADTHAPRKRPNQYPPRTLAERFWAKVDRSAGPDGCWPWTGARFWFGHGAIKIDGRPWGAHRIAWELTNGPIPDGLQANHRCDNPPCCNPAHLFLGTQLDNVRDMDAKGRRARRAA